MEEGGTIRGLGRGLGMEVRWGRRMGWRKEEGGRIGVFRMGLVEDVGLMEEGEGPGGRRREWGDSTR